MKECFNNSNTLYEMYANNEDAIFWWYLGYCCTWWCADACLPISKHGAIICTLWCKNSIKHMFQASQFLKQSCIKMHRFCKMWNSWKMKFCKNAINVCKISIPFCNFLQVFVWSVFWIFSVSHCSIIQEISLKYWTLFNIILQTYFARFCKIFCHMKIQQEDLHQSTKKCCWWNYDHEKIRMWKQEQVKIPRNHSSYPLINIMAVILINWVACFSNWILHHKENFVKQNTICR